MTLRTAARALALAGTLSLPLGGCDLITSSSGSPPAPSGLGASGVSTSTIELTWSEGSGSADEIEIQRAGPSGAFSLLAAVGAGRERYRDEGLAPATAQRYRIRACSDRGCSSFTEPVQGRTLAVLAVLTGSLPDGVEGEAYDPVTLRAGGGDGSYTWTVADGSLPPGLELSGGGTLSGTPTGTGSFEVAVRVTSGDGQTATAGLTLTIFVPLEITTASLPDAAVGEVYTEGLAARGGDGSYAWEVTAGGLPGGLALSREGIISGKPGVVDLADFTVRATSGDGQTATRRLSLIVTGTGGGTTVVILTTLLAPARVGGPYEVELEAIGGDGASHGWTVVGGSLPPGLSLDPDGRIQGTPTAAGTSSFTLEVSSGGERATADYTLEVVDDDTGGFHLTDFEVVPVDAAIRSHLDEALARWEEVVTGDVEGVSIEAGELSASVCGGFGELVNGTSIDDLLVLVDVESIDGQGGILAQAGPCVLRSSGDSLPAAGIVILDSDDLEPLVGTRTLTDLVAHELGHVLGFGTRWQARNLLSGAGTTNPTYTGAEGVARYRELGGTGDVPVEGDGGPGTADAHWDEDDFEAELMTGFSEPVGTPQPLSVVTVGSMRDLGYSVDFGVADPCTLPCGSSSAAARVLRPERPGYDVIYAGPVGVLPPDAGARE